MEQKEPPSRPETTHAAQVAKHLDAARSSATFAQNELVPPHVRFATLLAVLGLNDEEAAGLLCVARPVVHRTRTGERGASFDVATRLEAVFGIPAAHWREVPPVVKANAAAIRAQAQKLHRATRAKPKAKAA